MMSLPDGFLIEEVFDSAVTIVKNLPKEGPIKPSDELKLKLYAYYKQATHGPNDTSKPRFYQIVEAYKWDAWHKLGDMTKSDAMLAYIQELKQIMDTMSPDDADQDDSKRFEEVLGKKFYDYWFNKWQQREQLTASQSSSSKRSATAKRPKGNTNNDTQSDSSSGGSSVSLLEDTSQAAAACEPDQGGYKTPTSLDQVQATISHQMGDQVALAVLRLQHGLNETNTRLGRLEAQLLDSIRSLNPSQKQTQAKSTSTGRHRSPPNLANKLVRVASQMGTVHWFYLSYPILVYFIMRFLFDRQRRRR